jgi:hypothetical protein
MRMVMERGCPEEFRIHLLMQQVQGLEQRLELLEAELAALRAEVRVGVPAVRAPEIGASEIMTPEVAAARL